MNILSIQSHVTYGHVGNSVVTFALQRIGVDVWPVHTVQFSNHPGHGAFRGAASDAGLLRDLLRGVEERGVFPTCDGVLSGYMGSVDAGAAIVETIGRVRRANPAARYCCDPVIGDAGRIYVKPDLPDFIRAHALPHADVATPNQFELDLLSGRTSATRRDAFAAVDALHAIGPKVVMVTSLHTVETPADAIDVLVSDGTGHWRVRTPRLALSANGTGDLLAALFFAHWLATGSIAEALTRSVSSLFGVLRRTTQAGARELLLVAAQDELIAPSRIFAAEQL